jgi:hypothetical protein
MALSKDATARLTQVRGALSPQAKRLRRSFAQLLLAKLDAQLARGRFTLSARKEDDGASAGR